MVWSTVLGIGASLLGSSSAKKQASADRAAQQDQLNFQKLAQQQSFDLAMRQLNQQDDVNEYIRQMEQLNRITAADERRFQIDQVGQYQSALSEERRYAIDRQIKTDQDAAKQRAFQLEQLLKNQGLSKQERDFAVQQLKQAQSIASGERNEDLMRFYEEREQANQEREFMLDEYGRVQGQAQSERDYDLGMRDKMLAEIYGLQTSLRDTQDSLGYIPEIPQLNPADIDAEVNRRIGDYTADVDRATDRVASINEANLIRGGIDRSTPATARRADVASRMAQEYRNARNQAYQDAVSYITGRSNATTQNINDIIGRRGVVLGETAAVNGSAIEQLMNLPQVGSSLDAMQFANLIPSSVYSRNLTSANNYQAPVSIDSAIYDRSGVGSEMAPTLNMPSSASYAGLDVSSQIINPYNYSTGDAGSGYMQIGSGIGNNILNSATDRYNSSRDRYTEASSGLGQSVQDAVNDYSPTISSWARDLFIKPQATPMNSIGPMASGYRSNTLNNNTNRVLNNLANWRI
jgi:hypothetical protein